MSWPEFHYATEGHFDELKQKLGISEQPDMREPTDTEVQQTKQRSEKWLTFFKRPTLTTESVE